MADKTKLAEPDFHYAGLNVRAAAMALDLLIIAGYAVFLAIVASFLFRIPPARHLLRSAWSRDALAFFTLVQPKETRIPSLR